jgi:hypothetical protein
MDITESFEKRIKSRFSNRSVLFYNHQFDHFIKTVKDEVQYIKEKELMSLCEICDFLADIILGGQAEESDKLTSELMENTYPENVQLLLD